MSGHDKHQSDHLFSAEWKGEGILGKVIKGSEGALSYLKCFSSGDKKKNKTEENMEKY